MVLLAFRLFLLTSRCITPTSGKTANNRSRANGYGPMRPPFRGFVYIALVEPNLTVSGSGYASRAQKNAGEFPGGSSRRDVDRLQAMSLHLLVKVFLYVHSIFVPWSSHTATGL